MKLKRAMKLHFNIMPVAALAILFAFAGCDNGDEPGIAPTVTAPTPADGSIDVPLNTTVSAVYSQVMDPSTVTDSHFTLQQGSNNVPGATSYDGSTVTMIPTEALSPNTRYTATIAGARNAEGKRMASDFSWSFTTGAAPDNTAPTVVSTSPGNNATGTSRSQVVSVNFSELMDASTINASTFTLTKQSLAVQGTVAYSGTKATFTPNEPLTAGTGYTATLTTGMMDVAGRPLIANHVWSFTTTTNASGLAAVELGAAANYVILAKTAINNIPTSAITGHLGLSPAATTYITGFALTNATGYATSPQVTGKVYAADMASPTSTNLTTAVENMITAYNDAAGRPSPDFVELATGNVGGLTLEPGLYKWTSTVTMPTDLVISGGANDVWIFQIAGDLTMSGDVNITLEGGAQAKNIFWQVAGKVTIGTTAHFEGIILSMTGITLQTGAAMNGRALAQTAVILDANAITQPQ